VVAFICMIQLHHVNFYSNVMYAKHLLPKNELCGFRYVTTVLTIMFCYQYV